MRVAGALQVQGGHKSEAPGGIPQPPREIPPENGLRPGDTPTPRPVSEASSSPGLRHYIPQDGLLFAEAALVQGFVTRNYAAPTLGDILH